MSETDIRGWIQKVTREREEKITAVKQQCYDKTSQIRQERVIERKRINDLMDLKKASMPIVGTPEERIRAINLRSEIHNLDYEMQMGDIKADKRITDIKFEAKKMVNDYQRQWEAAIGVFKQALFEVVKRDDDKKE